MNINLQIPPSQAKKPLILSGLQANAYSRFQTNPNEYADSLSKKMFAVFMYLFRFRYKDGIILSNDVIARMAGCNRRTVERATRRFHDDGVILKYKPDTYCMNRYSFNPILVKSRGSFSLWFRPLTLAQKESYWEQGISGLAPLKKIFVVPNVIVSTKGKMTDESWKSLPLSVQVGASKASVYGLSRDLNSLNGNDDRWSCLSRPYNDLSNGFSEDLYPNVPDKICWDCMEDLSVCFSRGGHDKNVNDEYMHGSSNQIGRYMKKNGREFSPGELLLAREAVRFLGVSKEILESWECDEGLITYTDPFTGETLYRKDDLLEIKKSLLRVDA